MNKSTQPAMNAEQSNATQALVTARVTKTTQQKTQLLKQYKMEQRQAVKVRRMFRKHFQQSKKREEKMKIFVINFETKMQLEQPRFEQRKLELEMQLKELETKHLLLLETKRELPKQKLNNFDGNPLERPEWSSMFIVTVYQRPIPDSEKMSHLKILLTGKARSAISGIGYSRQFYGNAWSILERNFGRPHVINDAQLESLRKASQLKPHDSSILISFSAIVANFVNRLKKYNQIGNLQSSSRLHLAVDKLHRVLKEKWWFYVNDKDEEWHDLIFQKMA